MYKEASKDSSLSQTPQFERVAQLSDWFPKVTLLFDIYNFLDFHCPELYSDNHFLQVYTQFFKT